MNTCQHFRLQCHSSSNILHYRFSNLLPSLPYQRFSQRSLPHQRLPVVPRLRREVEVWRAEAGVAREEAASAKRTLDQQQERVEFVLRQTAQVGQSISPPSLGNCQAY